MWGKVMNRIGQSMQGNQRHRKWLLPVLSASIWEGAAATAQGQLMT